MYYCLIETLLKYIVAPLPVRRAFRSRAMPAASANAACMASGRGRGTLPACLGGHKKRARFTSDALVSFGFTYV